MRLAAAFRYDVLLQFRHGFYYAYALVAMAYIVLMQLLPESYLEKTNILLTFSDPSMLGFFFIGGLVLLEKGQGIHDSLFVTPYTPEEYIWSKTLSLTVLSVATSWIIHASAFGFGTNPVWLLTGVAMTSVFFTFIGLGVAVRVKTINGFFFLSTLATLPFMLPVLETAGIWSSPLLAVLPTYGSLLFIGSPFSAPSAAQLLYSAVLLLAWIGLAYGWTRNSVYRFLVYKIGEGAKSR